MVIHKYMVLIIKETYAPTTTNVAVSILFQLGAMFGLEFCAFDVTAAFLEGKNDFKQYARLPPMVTGDKVGFRVEVIGNFYGEKQGPKIWNDQLDKILKIIGFIRCPVHPFIYILKNDKGFIYSSF